MVAKKVLTRAESRAQTREDILDAAEELFIANGYHGTSLAAIAAEAGRTIGAVYSNYESKDDLCVEVLKRRSSGELTSLMTGLMAADEDVESRLAVFASWWARVAENSALLILAAEYGISIYHSDQRTTMVESIGRAIESVRVLLEDFIPVADVTRIADLMDDAVLAIVSTGIGLSALHASGSIDVDRSAKLFTDEIRLWFDRLAAAADQSAR